MTNDIFLDVRFWMNFTRSPMYFPVNTRVYRQKHNLVHLAMMNAEELIKKKSEDFQIVISSIYMLRAVCGVCVAM